MEVAIKLHTQALVEGGLMEGGQGGEGDVIDTIKNNQLVDYCILRRPQKHQHTYVKKQSCQKDWNCKEHKTVVQIPIDNHCFLNTKCFVKNPSNKEV